MRLIDADELKDRVSYIEAEYGHIMEEINNVPTVDAVYRKRGEWIKNEGRFGWHCSECKVDNYYAYVWNSETGKNDFQDRYCPNCGAEMRGEEE